MRRIAVIGGTGFLGRHVVAEFLRRGHSVRALVRPAARLDDLDWPGRIEVVRADLRVMQDLTELFGGVDILVHLAAAVDYGCGLFLTNDARLTAFPGIPIEILT